MDSCLTWRPPQGIIECVSLLRAPSGTQRLHVRHRRAPPHPLTADEPVVRDRRTPGPDSGNQIPPTHEGTRGFGTSAGRSQFAPKRPPALPRAACPTSAHSQPPGSDSLVSRS